MAEEGTPVFEDKELKIDSNQINVSNRKNQSFYVFLCKKTLEKHEDLVLHALGNATTISVIAAEMLVRNGYAEYVKFETKTIEVEESRRGGGNKPDEGEQAPRLMKRAKLLITLKRCPEFFENMKKFNEIREENEKYIDAEKSERDGTKKVFDE